jgi:AcrR family transcriptional regulator
VPRLAEQAKKERRRALIDAARRCAERMGFSELTVEEICGEAGVSKGTFYLYFESKQQLLLALLDEDAAFVDSAMQGAGASSGPGTRGVRAYVQAMVRRGEDPAMVQIRADLWAAMLTDQAVRTRFSELVAARRGQLKASIQEAIDAGELVEVPANALASILLALGDGLTLHGGLDPGAFRWTNVRKALDAILEGLAPARP